MTIQNMDNPNYWKNKLITCLFFLTYGLYGQDGPKESDYYRLTTLPVPEGIHLESGGVTVLPNGNVAVATRRGDVWFVANPTMKNGSGPIFKKFASGLHEPLGLAYKNGSLYTAQRGELTKLTDTNGDGIADEYRTVYQWALSANYHEYSYGPVLAPDGTFFVTTNIAFENPDWFRGKSRVPWRGWALKITEDGKMQPWATGMRSPAGYGIYEDELFYSENQGDWVGSGGIWHLPKGAFTGHPAGLSWTGDPKSPVKISESEFYERLDKREVKKNGRYVKPANIIDEEDPDFYYEVKNTFPQLQLPAVLLPHGLMGISNAQLITDNTKGKFGPFEGQLLIGDQGQSKIMRVMLEKINGAYQGAAVDFRSGFQSGVLRMDFDNNGNLFVGETNRGWGSAGTTNSGLEYVSWTGKMPFEMKYIKAMPDGFEIEFTKPVDPSSASYVDGYTAQSYLYKYHPVYGSPQTQLEKLPVSGVKISEDGYKVRIVLEKTNQYHVHEVTLAGVKSKSEGHSLVHPTFYYTLNNLPEGRKLKLSELSTKRQKPISRTITGKKKHSRQSSSDSKKVVAITEEQIATLLRDNTCVACHAKNQRMVGPSYFDISKRNYSNERIVELIYNPQPKNWPEYATPMAPMPQVPRDEALKIAAWINSLDPESRP